MLAYGATCQAFHLAVLCSTHSVIDWHDQERALICVSLACGVLIPFDSECNMYIGSGKEGIGIFK